MSVRAITVTNWGVCSSSGKAEEWEAREGDNLLCLVTAEGGWGKTALLAGLVHQAVKVDRQIDR